MSYLANGPSADADHNRKQAESQKRRLESLAEKRRLEQQRKELVSASLRNSGSNKRIVFDSDDDDPVNGEPRAANKRKQESQLTLFDDDDEDEVKDVEGEVEELVEARVGSKRGRKVAELQMQLGHDERFRVDDRFVDEHSASDSDGEDDVAKEKQSELDILSKVLGRAVTSTLPASTSKKTDAAARPFLRFDPTDPEHVEWLKNYQKKTGGEDQAEPKNESSSAIKNMEVKDDEVRRVEGTFFEMKSDFAEELKERLAHPNDNGFSFLAMIGRDHAKPVDDAEPRSSESAMHVDREKKQPNSDSLPGDLHSMEAQNDTEHHESASLFRNTGDRPCFFLSLEDPEIRQALASFRRLGPKERVAAVFQKHREGLVKVYKSQRKTAVRRIEEEKRQQLRQGAHSKGRKRKRANDKPKPSQAVDSEK